MEPPLDPGRVRTARRGYTKVVLSLLGTAAVLNILLQGLGFVGLETLKPLGTGALLMAASAVVWEVIERRTRGEPRPGVLSWMAFPLAVFLAVAALPFLGMAIYPPLEEFLIAEGRVEARMEGTTLGIYFPRAVVPGPVNIRLDDVEVPPGHAERAGGPIRWSGRHKLSLDLERLAADLPGAPRRPSLAVINAMAGSPRMRYETGDPVPHQQVKVR